jgi:hypothetical protein
MAAWEWASATLYQWTNQEVSGALLGEQDNLDATYFCDER